MTTASGRTDSAQRPPPTPRRYANFIPVPGTLITGEGPENDVQTPGVYVSRCS